MENLEEAAQVAAARWKGREDAKDEIRAIALQLLKTNNMTQVARIVGISRTSLYYFLYGRDGKANAAHHTNDRNISVHDDALDLRESA